MMEFTIIAVIALMALGGVAFLFNRYGRQDSDASGVVAVRSDCAACSVALGSAKLQAPGTQVPNRKCEQECMMEAAVNPVEYFDDEELDNYRNRLSDSYTDDEVEQFAYVLHTMQPDEVAAWNRSLVLRGITIPDQLRDELFLLIGSE